MDPLSPRGSSYTAANQTSTAARESKAQKKKAQTGPIYKFGVANHHKSGSSSSSPVVTTAANGNAGIKKDGVFRKGCSINISTTKGTGKKTKKKRGAATTMDVFERLAIERRHRQRTKI
jgi:hypothetical protein